MKHFSSFIFFIALSNLIAAQPVFKTEKEIIVGAKQFESYAQLVEAKSVAIVGNHTSMVDSVHLVDWLLAKSVKVKKVFAPEHGFRGTADAGEKVQSAVDSKTGLPLISLYGSHKKPTKEDLSQIDVVIYDIQDVGARFYTYISTMTYVMEACAENSVKLIVLDRPNPNGFYVDGPILKPEFKSFVGLLPIPVVHGMTVGELAQMINSEGWLSNGVKCELSVVSCKGYSHNDIYVLPIKPSPNLPNISSILLYPSLCFFEGTDISVGRGTDKPFEIFGHPRMTQGSFIFVPKSTDGAKHPPHENIPCVGWDLSELGGKRIQEKQEIILDWLINAYRDFPQKDAFFLKNGFFEKLAGNAELRKQIESGMSAEQIKMSWQTELDAFKKKRKQYLLYADFN